MRIGFTFPLIAALAIATPAAAQQVEQVHFARGATGTVIDGAIVGRDYRDYHLVLGAGQLLHVELETTAGSPYFNVIEPDAGDVAVFIGSTEGDEGRLTTPKSGAYTIRVYQMRASERRGERAAYRLSVSATGHPIHAPSASTDALVAGTPYHATATIPCIAEPDTPMGECRAGVIRRAGSATVHLDTPDGGTRTILFRGGRAVSSDSEAGLVATREGDISVVRIGTVEIYRIPDALIEGG